MTAKQTVQFSPAAVLQMRQVAAADSISVAILVERALSLYYLERDVKSRGGKLLIEEPGGGIKEIADYKPAPPEEPAEGAKESGEPKS